MSYPLQTGLDEVSDEKILSFMRPGVKTSPEEILGSIHGYEFLGVQREGDEKLFYYCSKYDRVIRHLVIMTGISEESALYILGELGADMSVWRARLRRKCKTANRKKMTEKATKIQDRGSAHRTETYKTSQVPIDEKSVLHSACESYSLKIDCCN